jgi:hypothetical protein
VRVLSLRPSSLANFLYYLCISQLRSSASADAYVGAVGVGAVLLGCLEQLRQRSTGAKRQLDALEQLQSRGSAKPTAGQVWLPLTQWAQRAAAASFASEQRPSKESAKHLQGIIIQRAATSPRRRRAHVAHHSLAARPSLVGSSSTRGFFAAPEPLSPLLRYTSVRAALA